MSATLLIDTSNLWINIGIVGNFGSYVRCQTTVRNTFQSLAPLIQELLEEARIDRPEVLVCVTGPGSFTGSRLGVSHARNLSQLWELKVVPVPSLCFYSYDIYVKYPDMKKLKVIINASQGDVYTLLTRREDFFYDYLEASPKIKIKDFYTKIKIQKISDFFEEWKDSQKEEEVYISENLLTEKFFVEQWKAIESKNLSVLPTLNKIDSPDIKNLDRLVLQFNDYETGVNWEELRPFYLKKDPAHSKYPTGFGTFE